MKLWVLLLATILLESCFSSSLNMKEIDYITRASQTPLEFSLPKEEAEDAWGRAQSFIGRYSSMRLHIVTDYVLETKSPQGATNFKQFGYYVVKTPGKESVSLKVLCVAASVIYNKEARQNAHILAYYMMTGEEPSPRIIKK